MTVIQEPQALEERKADASPGHRPFVPDPVAIPEFTWGAVVLGAVLGILFGASSLYLVLKVGLTVSASIPVAVLAITLFRVFSKVLGLRRATILELLQILGAIAHIAQLHFIQSAGDFLAISRDERQRRALREERERALDLSARDGKFSRDARDDGIGSGRSDSHGGAT